MEKVGYSIKAFGQKSTSMRFFRRAVLRAYPWPGNVRELKNCIESMVVIARDKRLTMRDMPAISRRTRYRKLRDYDLI